VEQQARLLKSGLHKKNYLRRNKMKIRLGDCLEEMRTMEDSSVDSIVTDPPYGLSFMGKKWDYDVPSVEIWKECLRVLKSGGYLLSFAGTRTQHRMAVNIEDAGFEIRDMIAWVYGSGFPKSHNIGKNIEKIKVGGIKNLKKVGTKKGIKVETGTQGYSYNKEYVAGKSMGGKQISGDIPVYEINNEYEGWGTALKPALEPITVARKPFKGTVANNVLKWGTGGINIDGCRVGSGREKTQKQGVEKGMNQIPNRTECKVYPKDLGRFPANLIHDGSDEVVGLFPETKSGGASLNSKRTQNHNSFLGTGFGGKGKNDIKASQGSAARFFYCAKASKSERNEGCEGLEREKFTAGNYSQSPVCKTCNKTLNGTNDHTKCSGEVYYREMKSKITANNHPTVKPVKLMQYLVRLVTPKDGTVLDPFMGSGSTGKACMMEGFDFIGIELAEDYFEIAKARIEKFEFQHELFEK